MKKNTKIILSVTAGLFLVAAVSSTKEDSKKERVAPTTTTAPVAPPKAEVPEVPVAPPAPVVEAPSPDDVFTCYGRAVSTREVFQSTGFDLDSECVPGPVFLDEFQYLMCSVPAGAVVLEVSVVPEIPNVRSCKEYTP